MNKLLKRSLAFIGGGAMLLNLIFPCTEVFAEDEVACIWTSCYDSLETAISNSNDWGIITLKDSVQISSDLTIKKELTLDLWDNSVSFSVNNDGNHYALILEKDTKITWNWKISARRVETHWKLTLENWEIEALDSNWWAAVRVEGDNAEFIMQNWTLSAVLFAIYNYSEQWKVEINWWTISSTTYPAINNNWVMWLSWWTISSASDYSAIQNYWELVIDDWVNVNWKTWIYNENDLTINWWSISASDYNWISNYDGWDVEINWWNISSDGGFAISNVRWNVTIKGGVLNWNWVWVFLQWDWSDDSATLDIQWWKITWVTYWVSWNWTTNNKDTCWDTWNCGWTKITISGWEVECTDTNDCLWIYNPQKWELIISGWSIKWRNSALEMRSWKLNISDWELTATAEEYKCTPNWNGSTTVWAAIAIAQHTTKQDIDVKISWWIFNWVRAFNLCNPQQNPNPTPKLHVSWWKFYWTDSAIALSNGDWEIIKNFISAWVYSTQPEADYIEEWYSYYKIDWNYAVTTKNEAISKAKEDESVQPTAVIPAWTTVSFDATDTPDPSLENVEWQALFTKKDTSWNLVTTSLVASSKSVSQSSAESSDNNVKSTELNNDANKVATIEWWIEVYMIKSVDEWGTLKYFKSADWSTAIFTNPIAIPIPVSSSADGKNLVIKVRHWTSEYWFDWLTLDPAASCDQTSWTVVETSKRYDGTQVINPVNWKAWIYTCSASTFVAYSVADKPAASSSSSSGRSSWWTKKDDKKDDTQVIELKWEVTEESTTTWEVKEENTKSDVIISDAAKAAYNEEQLAAYQWAYDNDITTINDVDKARLSDPLTRAELAKMMSQYISSVLKKSPIKTDLPRYKDVDESLWDLADYIVKAYQYQIMGINADGSALENFNPNGLVTRAEYATVFSRVLYWDKYNQAWADYYSKHLAALKEAGILSNDDPTIQEVRGWVMLMMYRSANEKAPTPEEPKAEEWTGNNVWIANPASTYCIEQEWEIEIREDAEWAQYGVCKFKDGTEVEEWEYFRANHKDETSTGAVAENATGAVATTWAAENK